MHDIEQIINCAVRSRASDVHITAGLPVRFRVDGVLVSMGGEPLSENDCDAYARAIAGDAYAHALEVGEYDTAAFLGGVRCRVNLFLQQGTFSAAIRLLAEHIPDLDSLGLPPVVPGFASLMRGLVIVTGQTGSGKSTTLAALIDRVNHNRAAHILTLEDPIEYIHTPDRCSISQREVGRDTRSFASGLRAALREDPDVILVGEMRDAQTMETAFTAAETGHLVLTTLHTSSAPDAIDRIVDSFPEERQRQIRMQLSLTLRAVVSQQLLPKADGHGRVAACEVMVVNPAIRNLIREGKTPQIYNALATSSAEGSVTMDNQLAALVRRGTIRPETALSAALDPEYLRRVLR